MYCNVLLLCEFVCFVDYVVGCVSIWGFYNEIVIYKYFYCKRCDNFYFYMNFGVCLDVEC